MATALLRLLTCGSVDDGKSTLIGRLMHDCGAVPSDRLEGLTDFSLLADGLEAEREQGITIDVAHLYFGSAKRRFILAEMARDGSSERSGRLIDRDQPASMERKKRQGYF